MAEDDEYPDDMPSAEESLGEEIVESDEDLVDGLEDKLLEGDDEVEGEAISVMTSDGEVIVMPGADCTRCGSPSSGVVVASGNMSKWSGGDVNPYCDECRREMFPNGVKGGFEWREY